MNTTQEPNVQAQAAANGLRQPWIELVDQIRANDPAGMAELYRHFSKGIRYFLSRQVGPQDLDDKVHESFLVVVQAIRRGDLREPERLMGYVRTVERRQVAGHVEAAMHTRRTKTEIDPQLELPAGQATPKQAAIHRQDKEIAKRILSSLSERDREILTRFYLQEQSAEEICAEMDLTATQFRLIKSRAKARFQERCGRRLAWRGPGAGRL